MPLVYSVVRDGSMISLFESNRQIGVGVGTKFIEYTYLYAASLTSIGSCF